MKSEEPLYCLRSLAELPTTKPLTVKARPYSKPLAVNTPPEPPDRLTSVSEKLVVWSLKVNRPSHLLGTVHCELSTAKSSFSNDWLVWSAKEPASVQPFHVPTSCWFFKTALSSYSWPLLIIRADTRSFYTLPSIKGISPTESTEPFAIHTLPASPDSKRAFYELQLLAKTPFRGPMST